MSQLPPIVFSHITALQIARIFANCANARSDGYAGPYADSSSIQSASLISIADSFRRAGYCGRASLCVGKTPAHYVRGLTLKPSRMKFASRVSVPTSGIVSFLENVPYFSGVAARDAQPVRSENVRAALSRPIHFITASKSQCRREGIAKPHLFTRELPSNSVLKIAGSYFVCTPEFAFLQMAAQRKEMIFLLELGYELCGTYQALVEGSFGDYGVAPLMTVASLRGFVEKNPSLPGACAVRRILPFLADGSASVRETKLALLLGLPRRFGGYGFGVPAMNYSVLANDRAKCIAQRSSFRCDVCWPDCKVDVEYQSKFVHSGETARIRDSRRANALASMGWTVIGVTNEELESPSACDAIAEAVRKALGKQRRYAPDNFKQRNEELRWELGLPN